MGCFIERDMGIYYQAQLGEWYLHHRCVYQYDRAINFFDPPSRCRSYCELHTNVLEVRPVFVPAT